MSEQLRDVIVSTGLPLCTCTLRFSSTFFFPSQQEMVASGKIREFAEPVEVVEGGEIVRAGGGINSDGIEGERKQNCYEVKMPNYEGRWSSTGSSNQEPGI